MAASIQNSSDGELLQIATAMATAISADPAAFGLTAAYAAALTAKIDKFRSDINEQAAAMAKARSRTAAKNASRDDLEGYVCSGRNVAKAAGTPSAKIASLGLPVSSSKTPSSATVPLGFVDTSERLRHTISWHDAATTKSRRRPRGVLGCEIWVKIGDPAPGGEKDCRFLTVDAATPYLAELDPADVGKTAHYMFRWRMRDGSISGWSETVGATITG